MIGSRTWRRAHRDLGGPMGCLEEVGDLRHRPQARGSRTESGLPVEVAGRRTDGALRSGRHVRAGRQEAGPRAGARASGPRSARRRLRAGTPLHSARTRAGPSVDRAVSRRAGGTRRSPPSTRSRAPRHRRRRSRACARDGRCSSRPGRG